MAGRRSKPLIPGGHPLCQVREHRPPIRQLGASPRFFMVFCPSSWVRSHCLRRVRRLRVLPWQASSVCEMNQVVSASSSPLGSQSWPLAAAADPCDTFAICFSCRAELYAAPMGAGRVPSRIHMWRTLKFSWSILAHDMKIARQLIRSSDLESGIVGT